MLQAQADPAGKLGRYRLAGMGTEPGTSRVGRWWGGWTTTTQLASQQGGKVVAVAVPGRQGGDRPPFIPVLSKVRAARPGRGRPPAFDPIS